MTKYDDRVRKSDWKSRLPTLKSLVNELPSTDSSGSSVEDAKERFGEVFDYVDAQITASESSLVSQSVLRDINNIAANIQSQLQAFRDTSDPSQINSADEQCDELLRVAVLPAAPLDRRGQMNQLIQRFDEKTSSHISEIESAVQNATSALSRAEAELQSQSARSDNKITELETRLDTFKTDSNTAVTNAVDDIKQKGEALHEQLEQWIEESRQVLGVNVAKNTAASFKDTATDQKKLANTWRNITVVLFAVGIGISLWSLIFFKPASSSISDQLFFYITRTLLVGGLTGGFVAYTAVQSRHHRHREEANERLANELSSFRPFLAELDKGDLTVELKEASKRYFVGRNPKDLPPHG